MIKTPQQIIELIINAKSYVDVFENLDNYDITFTEYIKLIHPDLCKLPNANDATVKLNKFKTDIEKGKVYKDDAGIVTYFPFYCIMEGNSDLLRKSLSNYQMLLKFNSTDDLHFHKYLPKEMKMENDKLKISFEHRAVPLSSIKILPQEHVNWVLSRLLEIIGWLEQKGYCHAGINLDSVYIVPETHGIILTSFYHLTKEGQNLKTISGRYKSFYPHVVFIQKTAGSFIDIELSKRVAAFLLGDTSGNGTVLRKTHNIDFINFLLTYDVKKSSFHIFKEYRNMLQKNFEKKFHKLNI